MQNYLGYLSWCAQAKIPTKMILSEKEWVRQVSSLPTPQAKYKNGSAFAACNPDK